MTYLILATAVLLGTFLINTNTLSNVFFDSIQFIYDLAKGGNR